MKALLRDNAYYSESDLHAFSYYNNYFGYSKSTPIQKVAEGVAREITEIYYDSGCQPVDLVTHSMGGLVVRAMLAYDLIDAKCIGKFISLAAPHYGQNIGSDLGGYQAGQMKYGSQFLWELADAWHFKGKQIPETLCIAGASQIYNGSYWDGLVHVWSAALGDMPVRYVNREHSPSVSVDTKASTGIGSVVGIIFGGFWGAILGGVVGNTVGKSDTDNVIYKCKQGTSDDVYKLVYYYLSIGYAWSQSGLNYSSPASDITSKGGVFFQILDSANEPAQFKPSDKCLVHTYWHSGSNKRIVADYLEHGQADQESQSAGVEFVYGTMPEGDYDLTAYASQTTPAFTWHNVPVRGGRVTVVRLRAWDGRVFLSKKRIWESDTWQEFQTGGCADWTEVTTPTYNGFYAFKSGTIGHGMTTWMEKEVSGPGRLTFYWKPSSEADYDISAFSVNGVDKCRISGVSNEWSCVSCTIYETGSHTLRWTYSKDRNTVNGSDCVWVDGITWQPQSSVSLVEVNGAAVEFEAAEDGKTRTAAVAAGTKADDVKVVVGGVDVTAGFKVTVKGTTATMALMEPFEVQRVEDDAPYRENEDGNTVTLNVEVVPGLYYAADSAASLEALKRPGAATPAKTGDAIVAPKQGGEKGFYKVWVSDAPIEAE